MLRAAVTYGLTRGATCLTRALVLHWLLLRRGITSELRVGVRKNHDGLLAHAWVEWAGIAVSDGGDEHQEFLPFAQPILATGDRVR